MLHLFIKLCCAECGEPFDVPVYCGDRFCPVCSVRRLNRVRKRMDFLVKMCKRPRNWGFKMLTLTIRNQADLPGMVKDIVSSFRKLRNRQFWKNNVDGGAYVVELSGNPGNWHAHLHIVMQANFMPFDILLKLWRKVSSGRGVWIDSISPDDTISYITKYLTKPDVSEPALKEINLEMQNVRLFSPFGSWHALCSTYEQPKTKCKRCPSVDFMPWDLIYGKCPQAFSMETSRAPPEKPEKLCEMNKHTTDR